MHAQTLHGFFENESHQLRALDEVVRGEWLSPSGSLALYDASWCAFDPALSGDDAFPAFKKIYDELAGKWQVFRPRSPSKCWPAQQIFGTIKDEFAELSWRGPVNLLTLPDGRVNCLEAGLEKMRGIKPNKAYPTMTVSKFLHFYNPRLFPVYDTEVIWNKVFRRFGSEYLDFCRATKIPVDNFLGNDTEAFLRNYMLWASSLLSLVHPRLCRRSPIGWTGNPERSWRSESSTQRPSMPSRSNTLP